MLDTLPTSSIHPSKAPNLNAQNIRATLPIFQRDNVNWKSVTLTSILKKIAPEEIFSDNAKVKVDQNNSKNIEITDDDDDGVITEKNEFKLKNVMLNSSMTFDNVELRLLDVDQLHLLAKILKVSINQTECKIESDILKVLKFKFSLETENNNVNSKLKTSKKLPKISKEKVSWTAENESFLVDLYDELRNKKYQVDQKFSNFISQSQGISTTHNPNTTNNHPATPIKRGIGASSRGIWAVLSDKFKAHSRFHVSVTECRNKLIILKRLRL